MPLKIYKPKRMLEIPTESFGLERLEKLWYYEHYGYDTLDFDDLIDEETGEIQTRESCGVSWYHVVNEESFFVKCIEPAIGVSGFFGAPGGGIPFCQYHPPKVFRY